MLPQAEHLPSVLLALTKPQKPNVYLTVKLGSPSTNPGESAGWGQQVMGEDKAKEFCGQEKAP